MDSEGTQQSTREGGRERPENLTPQVMRLGFREHPYIPRFRRGSGERSESESEDDAEATVNTEWLTSTPNVNPGVAGGPRVMRFGLYSRGGGPRVNWTRELVGRGGGEETSGRQDPEGAEPRVMRLGLYSGGGEEMPGREQLHSMDEPSVLRLARNSNVYLDTSDPEVDSDEDRGGGDDQPPHKRSKHHGVAETSSISTSSSDVPFRVPQGESEDDEEEFNTHKILFTLSPMDRLGQLIREDQTREDGSPIDVHKICCSTPYFFQPDRWSCGYRNLQMLLGSLCVLQIDEEKHKHPSSGAVTAEEKSSRVRSLPLDLSDRILVLAGVGEGFVQCGQGAGRDGDSSRIIARTAALRGGKGPNYGGGVVPSVLELQMLVERAWDAGYDPEGSGIFRPQGVRGNERWIGEAVSALRLSVYSLVTCFPLAGINRRN